MEEVYGMIRKRKERGRGREGERERERGRERESSVSANNVRLLILNSTVFIFQITPF